MRKILYSLLIFVSIFFISYKVSAATSDVYDMSEWIDISEFTLPDGINTEDYNIIITQRNSTDGYRAIYWPKSEVVYAKAYCTTSSCTFPYISGVDTYSDFGINRKKITRVSETSAFSKIFDSSTINSDITSTAATIIVYSNVDIYHSPYGTFTSGFFDTSKVTFDKPYKVKRSIEFNTSISSFDIYVDKDDELSDLSYKINYVDYNDYATENITKSKLYTVMFYGLKNENGLYHWEMLDDCTNWDYPSEYCHVKSKFEQLESELNKEGFTVEGYVDFLDIFNEYDTVRVVLRLDNALTGKIDYWDKNMKIAATDVDVNYFGFDYSRNLSDSDLYRYTIFSTKEQDLSGNLYIISQSNDITINYFDTKYANFKEYSSLADVKKQENFWLFNYEHIGLNNNLGFYLFTDRNLNERLVYQFYTNTSLYFSYNDSDTLDDTIYIDNTGNSTNGNIAIDPDELMNYEYETIDDLFENITKFNEKINVVSQEIHKVIQYAYDSLNIYIKSFLISIFTVILVAGTIVLIRR